MTPHMIPEMPAPPPLPKTLSEPARLAGVFFSPKETFPDIARRPRWWIPLILMAIMSSLVATSYGRRVGWEKVVRAQVENNPRLEQVSPEQREQSIRVATRIAGIIGYVAPLLVALNSSVEGSFPPRGTAVRERSVGERSSISARRWRLNRRAISMVGCTARIGEGARSR